MDISHAFRLQATGCERMGSALYARLLRLSARDIDDEGAVHGVVSSWHRNPIEDAVPLRLMGGVHRIVLEGRAPELAVHYPTTGGSPVWPACAHAFLATVGAHEAELRRTLSLAPQTNDVGRASLFLGGMLEIERLTKLPLRLRELGSSAGLNLLPDRYFYELGTGTWGNPDAGVVVVSDWRGSVPLLGSPMAVVDRRGCDVAPIDLTRDDEATRLLSYIWPDHLDRFARTHDAIQVARRDPPHIDKATASAWVAEQLASPKAGTTTVVLQSVLMQYLVPEARLKVLTTIRNAGAGATRTSPLAWLRFEPGRRAMEVRLSLWPNGLELTLAEAEPHGRWANWTLGAGVGRDGH